MGLKSKAKLFLIALFVSGLFSQMSNYFVAHAGRHKKTTPSTKTQSSQKTLAELSKEASWTLYGKPIAKKQTKSDLGAPIPPKSTTTPIGPILLWYYADPVPPLATTPISNNGLPKAFAPGSPKKDQQTPATKIPEASFEAPEPPRTNPRSPKSACPARPSRDYLMKIFNDALHQQKIEAEQNASVDLAIKENLHKLATYNNGNKAIHEAILNNNTDMVKKLALIVNLAEINNSGLTPLHLAVLKGNPEIVQILIKINPCVACLPDQNGQTPMHYAVLHQNAYILSILLTHETIFFINNRDIEGRTIAHWAALTRKNDVKLTELLGRIPLNLNIQDNYHYTVLQYFGGPTGDIEWPIRQEHKSPKYHVGLKPWLLKQ